MKRWPIVAGALLTILLCGLLLNRWLRPHDLAAARAAARAAGIPLTTSEAKRPKLSPGQDAAPEWIALAAHLAKHAVDETLLEQADAALKPGAKRSAAGDAALRRLVGSRRAALARLHAITGKYGAQFPHTGRQEEWESASDAMRRRANLLRAERLVLARSGRAVEAARNQARGFRISDHAAMDPSLIGLLVSASAERVAIRGLGGILTEAGPDAAVAVSVRTALRDNPPRRDPAYALRGEALTLVTILHSAVMDAVPSADNQEATSGRARRGGPLLRYLLRDPSEATLLRWMVDAVHAAEEPPARRLAAIERVDANWRDSSVWRDPLAIFARAARPELAKVMVRATQAEADRRVLLAAACVMEHRARHGAWPRRLADAMPEPPSDPFTQRPLSYELEADGFVVTASGGVWEEKPEPVIALRYPARPSDEASANSGAGTGEERGASNP